MIKNLLYTALFSVLSIGAYAQCTDWVNPSPTGGWSDFGTMFNGAPCTGESNEIDVFQVNASEAYVMPSVLTGGNYTFSICNGPGAGSWVPDFTIITPTGLVDAFGNNDGDICSITWTATETGTYAIVINEAENCGVANEIDNGFPMITTNSGGAECALAPVMLEGAESFEASTDLPACWKVIDADGDGHNWEVVVEGGYPFDGTQAIASFSYNNDDATELTPNNYLITPKLDITQGDSLFYAVKSQDPGFPEETYSVLISTTGSDVADFNVIAFTETLMTGSYKGVSVDLDAYAGQSIYIAFRHYNSTNNFAVVLDAIALPGVNCDPTAVNKAETVQSSLYPNPATDKLNVSSSLQGAATITIFDAVGRVVSQKNVNLSDATYTGDISSLESGVYVIQIQAGDKMATQRFIKQ